MLFVDKGCSGCHGDAGKGGVTSAPALLSAKANKPWGPDNSPWDSGINIPVKMPYATIGFDFIYRAMRGLPLPFTGSGEETRDFTYVDDIVDALVRAAYFEAAVGQEMNIASGQEVRILDMAERVNEVCGNSAGIVHAEHRVWDTKKRLLASIERAVVDEAEVDRLLDLVSELAREEHVGDVRLEHRHAFTVGAERRRPRQRGDEPRLVLPLCTRVGCHLLSYRRDGIVRQVILPS